MPRSLSPLPFHRALADALETLEPGLFRWFASDTYGKKYEDNVRLELLRFTYRMPRDAHATLYAMSDEVSAAFGLDVPVTLYQAQEEGGLNAGLVFVPSEAHVVLRGPVLSTLSEAEQRALLGHELAHHVLWTAEARRYRTTDALIEHMTAHVHGAPSHAQSALRWRRWTEIFADRGGLVASDDLHATIGCLVKMTTGLREVDAAAYLAQAEEVVGKDERSSEGITHPETFIRAFALASWHGGKDDALLDRLVAGKREIDALDLVQQRELTRGTRRLVDDILAPGFMQTESTLAHARRFFPESMKEEPLTLAWDTDSLAEYVAYVLLDFGMADPDIEEIAMPHVVHLSERLGVASTLARVAKKELRMSAATFAELEREGRKRATSDGATTPGETQEVAS